MQDPNELTSGITVFGSAIIRVAPDIAKIAIAVSRIETDPKKAFTSARDAAANVQSFLRAQPLGDFGSSQLTLSQESRYVQGETKVVGYKARIAYSILLRELDDLEKILSGVVSAGANEPTAVTFETSRLKEVRADARRQAVAAGREKAELYAHEAGIALGNVIAINDSNPDQLRGREGHAAVAGGGGADQSIDPAMITVGASVYLTFDIVPINK